MVSSRPSVNFAPVPQKPRQTSFLEKTAEIQGIPPATGLTALPILERWIAWTES
jgi:hypothetical protein